MYRHRYDWGIALELMGIERSSSTETTGVNVCDRRRSQVTGARWRRRRVQARADISASTLINNNVSFGYFHLRLPGHTSGNSIPFLLLLLLPPPGFK